MLRSVSATPALQGSPPFGPVMCINPPTADAITSYPPLSLYGPVGPYPVMEAYTSPACGRAGGRARVVEMCGVCVSRYGFGVCIVASWLRVCGESLRVASRAMGNRRYKPGFAADNASQPNPSPSSLPGKKFSISTSASAARACTTARPSWCFRSTAQLRLPRLTDKK